MISGSLLLTMLMGVQSQGVPLKEVADDRADIRLSAETWFNGLTLRPLKEQRAVVLFFRLNPPKEKRESERRALQRGVEALNRLARTRKDLLVAAISPDPEADVLKFIEALKPAFPVGARSTSFRRFSISEFPTILSLDPNYGASGVRTINMDAVDHMDWSVHLGPASVTSGMDVETAAIADLQESVRHVSPDETALLNVMLESLRVRMASDEFLKFCDGIEYLHGVHGPWLSRVRYQRHLADPSAEDKQSDGSPAGRAIQQWRMDGPESPAWGEVTRFFEAMQSTPAWTAEGVADLLGAHMTDAPADLVIRHQIIHDLLDMESVNRPALFRRLLDVEPDPIIRTRLILSLGAVSAPGDAALADYLQSKLATETNIYWVRPTMEVVLDSVKRGANGDRYSASP